MLEFYLSLVAEEDHDFFIEIYNNHRKQMQLTANEILRNEYDAEDVVHEVFTCIAKHYVDTLKRLPTDSDRRHYLLTSTKHAANGVIKLRAKEICFDDELLFDLMKDIPDEDFTELVHNKIEGERIEKAIQSLDEKYRNVLYYHYVLGLTVTHISDILGQNYETTKKQIARGKKKLISMFGYDSEYCI